MIEHSILPKLGRIHNRQFDATECVPNIQEAALLTASSIYADGNPSDGLHTESIERSAEDLIIMEAGFEALIQDGLIRFESIHDALVQVRGCQIPNFARETHVMAVVHL